MRRWKKAEKKAAMMKDNGKVDNDGDNSKNKNVNDLKKAEKKKGIRIR